MLDTIIELVLGPLILGAIAFLVSYVIVEIYKKFENDYKDSLAQSYEVDEDKLITGDPDIIYKSSKRYNKEKIKLKLKQTLLFWVIGFFLFYGVIL